MVVFLAGMSRVQLGQLREDSTPGSKTPDLLESY